MSDRPIIKDYENMAEEALREVRVAVQRWPLFASAHEAYAVLLEEVDELWEHVRVKQGERDLDAMQKEAWQVAAMAIRFATELPYMVRK